MITSLMSYLRLLKTVVKQQRSGNLEFQSLFDGQEKNLKEVILKNSNISLTEFIAVAKYKAKVSFSDEYIEKVNSSYRALEKVGRKEKLYGINTGLGDNCEEIITSKQEETFQKNILRSHAVAIGEPLSFLETRAIMLMVLLNLGRGYSGVSIETLLVIKDMLNKGIYPYAPSEGSVGYLSVEAHMFLTLIGEGKIYVKGKLVNSKTVFERNKIKLSSLKRKEALSLVSGTTSVTGIAILSIYNMYINFENIKIGSALSFEGLQGSVNELDVDVLSLKNHAEQVEVASFITKLLHGSFNLTKTKNKRTQDPLSLRTIPQVLGAFDRIFKETIQSVYEELTSVSDNPVIISKENKYYVRMNGNFDASYVSLHLNALSIATVYLTNYIERISNRFLDTELSGFPAFLINNPGLNNGLMIVHYTLAGLLNDMKALATPSNISNNTMSADQEDVVTFAYSVAKRFYKMTEKLEYITAIWFLICKQGLSFMDEKSLAPIIQKVLGLMAEKVSPIKNDRLFYEDIERLKVMLSNSKIIDLVTSEIEND